MFSNDQSFLSGIQSPVQGEHIVAMVHEHWMRYVFATFIYLCMTIVSFVILFLSQVIADQWMWISHIVFLLSFILILFTNHGYFLFILGESMSQVVVTNHRIIYIHDDLFLHHEMLEFSFSRLKMVESRQHGILQNILNYGELKFDTGPAIPFICHPNRVARDIQQAMGRV